MHVGIEVSLTADGIGLVFESSSILTGKEVLEADARTCEEVRRKSRMRCLLVDHSWVAEERIDSASLRALADATRQTLELIPDGIVAIVAPKDVLFGLSRMWAMLADEPNLTTRIVRTRGEAIAWLRDLLRQRQLLFRLTE